MLLKDKKKIFFNYLQKLKSAQEIDEKDIYNISISNDVAGPAGQLGQAGLQAKAREYCSIQSPQLLIVPFAHQNIIFWLPYYTHTSFIFRNNS